MGGARWSNISPGVDWTEEGFEERTRFSSLLTFTNVIYGTVPTWTCPITCTRSPPSPSSHDFLTPPLNEAPPPAAPPTAAGPSVAAAPPPPLDETLTWSYLHTGHSRVMQRGSDVTREGGRGRGTCLQRSPYTQAPRW